MKPLNVALVYRSRSPEDGAAMRLKIGLWSYPVPEFTWTGYGVANGFTLDRGKLKGHDLIFLEDWVHGEFTGDGPPVAYWIVESNSSPRREANYHAYAERANLVLLDQDRLDGWPVPAHRLAYAVNEHVFRPLEKTIDVAYHVQKTPERDEVGKWLADFCKARGYSYASGWLPVREYAESMGRARVVVHYDHRPQCRSHRVFDALACGACLVTSPLPEIDGDGFKLSEHYLEWHNQDELGRLIDWSLKNRETAMRGYHKVLTCHTWATRAKQLWAILSH
jgi:hypothetical protein